MKETKKYINISLIENPDIFRGYYGNNEIPDKVLTRLSKELGFSFELYNTINEIDKVAADRLVQSMSHKSNRTSINLLIDEESQSVLGISLEDRLPILNKDFVHRVTSLIESSNSISLDEKYHVSDDTVSSILVKKVDPIKVEISHSEGSSDIYDYQIGVLIVNNELESTYVRLVVYIDGQPIYLPASYYSATTNRYKKSTGDSLEALEVLVLKVIDDLREDEMKYKMTDFHMYLRVNKDIVTSFEEYNMLMKTMLRIPSIIDDKGFLEKLNDRYSVFENKYANLDDQKSSYLWRCTAMSDISIGSLVSLTTRILKELGAYPVEYFSIRELLGTYLSTSRIASEIAKETLR